MAKIATQVYVVMFDNGLDYDEHNTWVIGVCSSEEQAHATGMRKMESIATDRWLREGFYSIDVYELDGMFVTTIAGRRTMEAYRKYVENGYAYAIPTVDTAESAIAFLLATGWELVECDGVPGGAELDRRFGLITWVVED